MVHNFLSLPAAARPVDRQRGPAILRKLAAFVILLTGLGASHAALAQDFYNDAITLTQKPTGGSTSTQNYKGSALDSPYSGYTPMGNTSSSPTVTAPNLGTYDLNNNSTLTLSGGLLNVSKPGRGRTYPSAQVNYRVYLTGTTAPAYNILTLAAAGSDANGDPIFQNNGANVDLLNGLVNGGNYTVDVQFSINVNVNGSISSFTDPSNSSYTLAFYVTPPPRYPYRWHNHLAEHYGQRW